MDSAARAARPSVLIVGAGFGGIGMAVELVRAGFDDVTVLERAADIGGVWRDNTYPGAACDIPSPYYCYSYAPGRRWSTRFAGREEIHDYLSRVVDRYRIRRRIRLGTEVTSAAFDERTSRWRVETGSGAVFEPNVLVTAVGQLSRPAVPSITGAAGFRGAAFHSARWDHGVELAGKRVAVIGTGASAVQFVPRIQPVVERLTVFQRSAPYVVPKPERDYRAWHRTAGAQLFERALFWCTGEVATVGLTGTRWVARVFGGLAGWQLRRQVPDPALRVKLTPDYPIGCKRVLISNDYYPALSRPNVEVETAPIERITPGGVRTLPGREHPADVIIYGTGFQTTDFLAPMKIRGRAGRDLDDAWTRGARAYLGMAVPGFPNLFLMYGPNTNLGAGSIIYMLERQARYIRKAITFLATTGLSTVEVREQVAGRFDREIRRRLAGTVWTGCASWYHDAGGRVSTNWPGLVSQYHRRTRTWEPHDYHATAEATPTR